MKVAVVTGAAQGIGRRTAEILVEGGFALALIDLREPSETLAALKNRNADGLSFAADITRENAISEFATVRSSTSLRSPDWLALPIAPLTTLPSTD